MLCCCCCYLFAVVFAICLVFCLFVFFSFLFFLFSLAALCGLQDLGSPARGQTWASGVEMPSPGC